MRNMLKCSPEILAISSTFILYTNATHSLRKCIFQHLTLARHETPFRAMHRVTVELTQSI